MGSCGPRPRIRYGVRLFRRKWLWPRGPRVGMKALLVAPGQPQGMPLHCEGYFHNNDGLAAAKPPTLERYRRQGTKGEGTTGRSESGLSRWDGSASVREGEDVRGRRARGGFQTRPYGGTSELRFDLGVTLVFGAAGIDAGEAWANVPGQGWRCGRTGWRGAARVRDNSGSRVTGRQ